MAISWWGFPGSSAGKESACPARDPGLILEDPLEKGTATYSSILAWRIPWTEEPGGPTVHGVAKSRTQLSVRVHACTHTHAHMHTHNELMGEGCQNSEFYPTGVEVISFSPSISPVPKEAQNPEVHKDEHRNSSPRNLLFLVCGREKWTWLRIRKGSLFLLLFFSLFLLLFQSPGSTEVEAWCW